MKKNHLYLLIGFLVLSQIFLVIKQYELERDLDNITDSIYNQTNQMSQNIGNIYSYIEDLLDKENNIIASSKVDIGTPNKEDLTVPIIFSLTPKEVSKDTLVSLDFDGQIFPMDRNGINFTTTVDRDIFSPALPTILIDDNGTVRTMQDDNIGIDSIKDWLLPSLHVQLHGSQKNLKDVYSYEGSLNIEPIPFDEEISFSEISLVTKVDEKIISEDLIREEAFYGNFRVNKEIPLKKNQVSTMTLVAIDELGLEHHFPLDHWVGGSNMQREPEFDREYIYSADGKLLWKSE